MASIKRSVYVPSIVSVMIQSSTLKSLCTLCAVPAMSIMSDASSTDPPPFSSKSNAYPRSVELNDFLRKSEIPSTGREWMSVSKGLEVQPSPLLDEDEKLRNTFNRLLWSDSSGSSSNPYADQTLFVDGAETYYDGYAQAWRYLGFYVDCDAYAEEDRRRLNDNDGNGCVRYLLWAAYVDPYYGGNGLYEYQFYDRWDDEWTSYCGGNNNNNDGDDGDDGGGRRLNDNDDNNDNDSDDYSCRKMDCHSSDTHFQLMGLFKHADYDQWVEQLFKHEGVCIWTEDESDFMYEMEELLPKGCYQTSYYDDDGNKYVLYYGLMPQEDGDVSLGLYTDYRCSQVYGGEANVWDVVNKDEDRRLKEVRRLSALNDKNNNRKRRRLSQDNNMDLEETYEAYNSAFSIYKTCQPCIAYDLSNGMECDDDAGYTNVNQCMKFRTQCTMGTATVEDAAKATEQGSILSLNIDGSVSVGGGNEYTKYVNNYISVNDETDDDRERWTFAGATVVLVLGLFSLVKAHSHHKRNKQGQNTFKTPLMGG